MSFVFPEPEQNERAAALGLDIIPGTFGEGFGAAFDDAMVRNPTATIGRAANRLQYLPSTDEFGNEMPARTPSRKLTAQEANDQYGIAGHLKFDADIPEPIAQELKGLKQRELERQDAMRRAQSGIGTSLSAGLVATLLDPLNIASAFVPVVGQARFAALAARYGTTGARAIAGGIEGAAGALLLEPIVLAGAQYEQADYDIMDSLANVAFGTALGSGLHMVGGAVTDRLAARRDASTIERQIDDLPRADQEALARTAVAQMVEGRPVDVGPVVDTVRIARPENLRPTDGWKLHLNVSKQDDLAREISEFLTEEGVAHKVGFSGGQAGKDLTIYVGAKDAADALAQKLDEQFGGRLGPAAGDVLVDDVQLSGNVWGRFDVAADPAFHQYGKRGVPILKDLIEYGEAQRFSDDAILFSEKTLAAKYGEFFTGRRAPPDQPSNIAARADENVRYTDPEDAASADTTTRRVSAEAGQARPLADDLKAIEDELEVYESLIPADRETPGATPPAARVESASKTDVLSDIHLYFTGAKDIDDLSGAAKRIVNEMPADLRAEAFGTVAAGEGRRESYDLLDDDLAAPQASEVDPRVSAYIRRQIEKLEGVGGRQSDREAPGATPAEKEARVRATAYKAAAACAVRKG